MGGSGEEGEVRQRALWTWTSGGRGRGEVREEVQETDKERDAEKGYEEVFASLIRRVT